MPATTGRALTRTHKVLLFSATLAATAGVLTWRGLSHLPALPSKTHLSWWMLAIGFALADAVFDIHLDVNSDTYSLSLMEIPLVIGLFLANPLAMVWARLVGSGLAKTLYRRQSPLKVLFNLSMFALESAVAVVIFRSLIGRIGDVGPSTWGAAFAAATAANLISTFAVLTVITLNGGSTAGRDRRFIAAVVLPPIANTSLALGAAALLWSQPAGAWLLGAIAAVLIVAYRAYAALSQRYTNLQRLYEFTGAVQQAPQGDQAVVAILSAARSLLRAETAEVAVIDPMDASEVLVTRVTGDAAVVGVPVPVHELGGLWLHAATSGMSVRAGRSSKNEVIRAELAALDRKDVMIVPLRQEGAVVGTMLVADRVGEVSSFDGDDLRFFETVVNHAVVALDKSRLVARLEHEALHDTLTGLANRALFNARVHEAMQNRAPGHKVAVMLMDLDRFKEVNDTLGHHHGDRLLREVGDRLLSSLPRQTTVARLGGDEFAILVTGLDDQQDALRSARYIRDLVSDPFRLDDLEVDVGASIGVALAPDDGEDAATLLQRADVAMYGAKDAAGVEVYASDRDHYSPRRLALVAELRQAITRAQLEVHYQPKAELATGRIVGVEALLRWPYGDNTFVSPDEFIPIAEHTGLIRPLTHYVLSRAIAQCRTWENEGLSLQMSVNLSARNLVDFDLTADIRSILGEQGLRPSRLTLEITESSIMSDPARTVGVLNQLAAMGIRLSVDDFGTGYSSLTYLKRLPVREVKIDKSFVIGMHRDTSDAAIVRSIVDLGANLGLTVVAEGVETKAAWDALHDLGCPVAQGYYLARPLPAEGFTAWLAEREGGASIRPLTARRLARTAAL